MSKSREIIIARKAKNEHRSNPLQILARDCRAKYKTC